MAATITTGPAPIERGTIYTLPDFMRATGLGKHAMRTARNQGLRVRRLGNRAYVHSDDFFAYVDAVERRQTEGG